MSYSDVQNRAFAKIAYFDLSDRYEYFSTGKEGSVKIPLSDLLYPSEKRELLKDYGITEQELKKWSLVGVHDTNSDNGFAACVIDTGDGEAAVAFRGSEGGAKQFVKDWINADFKLLNSTMTTQQAEVRRMMNDSEFQTLMSHYGSVSPVGHSLGGNLAEYYTVVSGEYGLYKQIDRCVSLDGPGFSTEFISEYKGQIAQIAKDKKMTHYRWSPVGEMLFDLPIGSNQYKNVESAGILFGRHTLKNSKIENGIFAPADKTIVSLTASAAMVGIGVLTKGLDSANDFSIGSTIVEIGLETAVTVIAVGGYAVCWVVELLDGTTTERRKRKQAQNEAAENPEFYIDAAAFERLANESKRVAVELKNIASFLRKVRNRPTVPVIFLKPLYAIVEMIDDLINTGSYCAKMAEESKSTLDAVITYLQETATDIKLVEKDAISLIESWGQR